MATLVLDQETADSQLIHLDKPSILIGCSPDADVCLESKSVSDCHARIEHKPDGDYLISLTSSPDVFINGVETTFQRLEHGDTIEIGDVTATFLQTNGDGAAYAEAVPEKVPRDATFAAGTTALTAHPINAATTCPQCGLLLTPGVHACPQCGLPASNLPAIPMNFIPPTPMNQAGSGVLPIIAFLAALTVVGGPIAIVLGLMTLSTIRHRGGTVRDQKMATWSIGLGLLWTMLGLVALGGIVRRNHQQEQLNTVEIYEAKVIRALKNLACAQKYTHTIEFYDDDSDGFGEYGELSALAETKSPFFDTDLSDGIAYEYQFTIREASEGRFLAVAEPFRYADTRGRTFVIDQLGQIRGDDAEGKRFGQIVSVLPVLQGERSAYYEIDDEIAKDVLNYAKSLSSSPEDQEKKKRILRRLRKEYSLTSVGRELEGMEETVDRFVIENRAQALHWEAQEALQEENQDVALAKLTEIKEDHPSFSKIAAVERELIDLRSVIAQQREKEAEALFSEAEDKERQGVQPQEIQQLYQRIEKLYPDTEIATRITSLKPELKRQLRERNAEDIFSNLMELSPENEYGKILNQANQFRRNYNDTDLFEKVEEELTGKERKARANAWRFKTQQNIAAGRMRGALAQLESAIRENPDMQYDLRDLCSQLYRSVADKMVEEGDARGALMYYIRLNRLLQASNSEEQVSQELLATLHNDVGQADYERRKYEEARWHLASAAWQYEEDAQFGMRLGASSLYSGLYRPSETALTQALNVRPDMESALLYRAYLNMRVVLTYEEVIAKGLQVEIPTKDDDDSKEPEKNSATEDDEEDEQTGGNEDDDEENESEVAASNNPAPSSLDFSFADNENSEEPLVPEPTDLDLIIHYNDKTSRQILPSMLQFLVDLQDASVEFSEEFIRAEKSELASVKLGQLMQISEFRNQLSGLRSTHLEDLTAQKKLCSMMEEMKRRAQTATADIQLASDSQLRIQSLAEHILPQINEKCTQLFVAADLLAGNMDKEIHMREKIFKLAEDSLQRCSSFSGATRDVSRGIKYMIHQADNIAEIDQALLALRNSMEVKIDLTDILRAAEGHTTLGGN